MPGRRWEWRVSPSPREMFGTETEARTAFVDWMKTDTNASILDRFGDPTGYDVVTYNQRFNAEAGKAWRNNTIERSSGIAQGFWLQAQEKFVRLMEESKGPMPPEVAADFRKWNLVVGKRHIDGFAMPWLPAAVDMIVDGTLQERGSEDVKAVLKTDLAKFYMWQRSARGDQDALTSVLPADLDGPVNINDPRVRHLWVQAAEVSRERDMCGTYDTIARKTGVPSRPTLRATGELKSQMRLSVQMRMNQVVDNPDKASYDTLYAAMPASVLRERLLKMSDTELKNSFTVVDYKQID